MSRLYAALDLIWPIRPDDERIEMLIAEADDESPTAIEERPDRLRIYFPSPLARGRAAVRLVALEPDLTCEPVDVPDEAWAERSQASLGAVRVGHLLVAPPWADTETGAPDPEPDVLVVTIQPSMGFGTAHHASTRLCLRLLQDLPVTGASVLDAGTGSGVLAIAAARLGAARVRAIDNDPDALISARENVGLNDMQNVVTLEEADLATSELDGPTPQAPGSASQGAFDFVLANLTGAALIRHASQLATHVRRGGSLIASGFGPEEVDDVVTALTGAGLALATRADEEGWSAARLTRS
jgi:ribosomal protein L11 methyltransferase